MSLLHVHSAGKHVAMINLQPRGADSYRPEEPWLLLRNTGRIDRYATQREAKLEAMKSYPSVIFSRKD